MLARGKPRLPTALALAHTAWLALSVLFLVAGLAAPALAQSRQADIVRIDAIISPITERYLERALQNAHDNGASVVVVTLDTPGGLLDATRDMVEDILASPVPVVVYVSPAGGRAASAGTFITAAAHIAAMAPGTNIGAASPVSGQGGELDETIKNKAFQDAAAEMRAIAEVRGRPAQPLEATVLEAASYTAEEALQLGIIDYIASSIDDLLTQIDGVEVMVAANGHERPVTLATAGASRRERPMGLFDRLLSFIADPSISYLLISLGGLGLVVELWNPGLIFPGVIGAIALILGLMALGSLPGNWAGVALILLAFALITIEFFTDSSGLFGALGVLSLILGGVILFWRFGTPSPMLPDIAVSPWALAPVGGAVGIGVALFVRESRRAQRILRGAPVPEPLLVGAPGTVIAAIARNGEGKVQARGETWNARDAAGGRIDRGARIIVRAQEGAILVVEPQPAPRESASKPPPHE